MLIRTIEEVRAVQPVNRNMKWESIAPFVETAEYRYMKTAVLGVAQYNALDAGITANSLTAAQQALLDLARKAIVNYALFEAVPSLSVMFSDLGIVEPQADKSAPASQWRVGELRASYWTAAQVWRQGTQELLQDNQADYPLWVASSAYSVFNKFFLRTARELAAVIGMSDDIASFVAMRPAIERAEETTLRACCGLPLLTDLKDKMKAGTLSTLETEVVNLCRKVTGHYALYEALPTLTLSMREGVLQVVSNSTNGLKLYQPLSDAQRLELRTKAERDGRGYLVSLKAFLEENADSLPVYKGSPAFEGKQPEITLPDNYARPSFHL